MIQQSPLQRTDLRLRQATPIFVTTILAILSVIPLGIPGYPTVVPSYAAMAVFYWAVFRPDLQPTTALFLIGVLHDVLAATPLGFTALGLLVVHALAISQRKAFLGKPFALAWLGFIVIQAIVAVLSYLLINAVNVRILSPEPAVFQYLLTVLLFPLVAWIFVRIHRYVVR